MAKNIVILDVSHDPQLEELGLTFQAAAGAGCQLKYVHEASDLLAALRSETWHCDLIVVDHQLGDGHSTGLEILEEIRSVNREIPVLVVAEEGNVALASEAIHSGATDFLVRGKELSQRVSTSMRKIRRFFKLIEHNRLLSRQNQLLQDADRSRYEIFGVSPAIREILDRIERVARIPRPVLITGERGTGKELVARAIHEAANNGRKPSPLVTVNCAAFPDNLLENELFGHEKGAYTGADRISRGKFEQADGGTLFLDEIGNMSLPFQQKILRVVEYARFTRVGGNTEVKANTRIIAATNANLQERMDKGLFLRDLYDRLNFENIHIPGLRERKADVAALAEHFMHRFMQEIPDFKGKRLSQEAIKALQNYSFPGNVRELKNIMERAVYRDTTNEITLVDLGLASNTEQPLAIGNFKEQVSSLERKLILGSLEKAGGNKAEAARILGLNYHQFRYYEKKYRASLPKFHG
ncbi:MAG: sigma-54 dependent transcriptional regulator [Planctomycetota bacterium]|nr:sigma-54 dependent transcriptional regulator [Planctomycetota bacterium]